MANIYNAVLKYLKGLILLFNNILSISLLLFKFNINKLIGIFKRIFTP